MRIIAGKHRGRNIRSEQGKEFRPTMGKTREALFSILTSGQFLHEEGSILTDATVLDICCGTGALGLEALSRGAGHVIFVDNDPKRLQIVRDNAINFGEEKNITIIRNDAASLPKAYRKASVVLIDPPYRSGIAGVALVSLHKGEWLEKGAVIVVEIDKKEPFLIPEAYSEISTRVYGKTKLVLLQYDGN